MVFKLYNSYKCLDYYEISQQFEIAQVKKSCFYFGNSGLLGYDAVLLGNIILAL
jgi:hypothetical protein